MILVSIVSIFPHLIRNIHDEVIRLHKNLHWIFQHNFNAKSIKTYESSRIPLYFPAFVWLMKHFDFLLFGVPPLFFVGWGNFFRLRSGSKSPKDLPVRSSVDETSKDPHND